MPLPDSPLASATSLSLAAQPVLLPGQVGGGSGDTYYQVSLTGRSSVFVGLSQLSGNADLQFLDSTGVALQASANAGTASEWIEILELAVGTYYLQVTTADVEPVSYTLNGMLLVAPETSVTGQLPDASGTGGGNGSDFFSGGVWMPAPPEPVTGGGALTPMPEGLNPDASFQLDGDGSPSLSMSGSGEDLAGNDWQSAYDTGILSGVETYSGGISGADGIDIYRFELNEATVAGIVLERLTADLDMELYNPEDSLGWYYPKAGLQSELMQVRLDPGTYYVSVRPPVPTVSGDYVLRLVFNAAPAVPSGLTLVNSPSGHATSNLTPTLSGQAQPGTHVMVLYETGYPAGEATTDSQGKWSLTTETLAEGTYAFRAVAFTNEGFYSEWSAPLQITVDRFGGSSVSGAPVLLAQLLEDTAPANQTNTDSITRKASISGRVSSSAVVAGMEVSFGLNEAFTPLTTVLNSDGSFTLTDEDLAAAYGGNLPDGHYLLRLQAIASTGSRSNEQLIRFTLDTTAPTLDLTADLIEGIRWIEGQALLAGTVIDNLGSTEKVRSL